MGTVTGGQKPMKTPTILLGTTNPAKERKLRWVLEGLPLELRTPSELGLTNGLALQEQGDTHQEIAQRKAAAWSQVAGMPALSSDGGLVIPALGSRWDSLLTHRFEREQATDHTRAQRLLELMRPYRGDERRATWVEALAIAYKGRVVDSWHVKGPTGSLGEKPDERSAHRGFWVFSIWYFPSLGKFYGELNEKELVSIGDHWSQLRSRVQAFFEASPGRWPIPGVTRSERSTSRRGGY